MDSEKFKRMKTNPGAIINTDEEALKAYKARKKNNKEIDNLKHEVSDIKIMLNKILEKLS